MSRKEERLMEKSKLRPKLTESAPHFTLYREYSLIYNQLKNLQASFDNLIEHNHSQDTLLYTERSLRVTTQNLYYRLLEKHARILPPKELTLLDRLDDEDYEERNKSLKDTEKKKPLSTVDEEEVDTV